MSKIHLYLLGWSLATAISLCEEDTYRTLTNLKTVKTCLMELKILNESSFGRLENWIELISAKLSVGGDLKEKDKLDLKDDLIDIERSIRDKIGI